MQRLTIGERSLRPEHSGSCETPDSPTTGNRQQQATASHLKGGTEAHQAPTK